MGTKSSVQDTGYLSDLTKSLKNMALITVKQRSLRVHPRTASTVPFPKPGH